MPFMKCAVPLQRGQFVPTFSNSMLAPEGISKTGEPNSILHEGQIARARAMWPYITVPNRKASFYAVTFRRDGFLVRGRFCLASSFKTSSFDTVKIWRTALSNRFHGVLPSTFGAGSGFMAASYHYLVVLRKRVAYHLLWHGKEWKVYASRSIPHPIHFQNSRKKWIT